jgi:hypothetical protein
MQGIATTGASVIKARSGHIKHAFKRIFLSPAASTRASREARKRKSMAHNNKTWMRMFRQRYRAADDRASRLTSIHWKVPEPYAERICFSGFRLLGSVPAAVRCAGHCLRPIRAVPLPELVMDLGSSTSRQKV